MVQVTNSSSLHLHNSRIYIFFKTYTSTTFMKCTQWSASLQNFADEFRLCNFLLNNISRMFWILDTKFSWFSLEVRQNSGVSMRVISRLQYSNAKYLRNALNKKINLLKNRATPALEVRRVKWSSDALPRWACSSPSASIFRRSRGRTTCVASARRSKRCSLEY